MSTIRALSIEPGAAGMRLDVFLAGRFAETQPERALSRAEIQRLISAGLIKLNGAPAKCSARVRANDRIDIEPLAARESPLEAQALPLEILYEDRDCIVVNKAPGIVVHPAAGRKDGTLVNALLYHCPELAQVGGERRPGIVHRLDKDTSGVMIVAKTVAAYHQLVGQFKNRRVKKEYLALAWGRIAPAQGRIDRPIGRHRSDRKRMSSLHLRSKARPAETQWQVLEYFLIDAQKPRDGVTLVRLLPRTGRTHQLRVHLADAGFALVGDKAYGRKRPNRARPCADQARLDGFSRQALHAEKLTIMNLRTGAPMEFHAPLAPDMKELLATLRRAKGAGAAAGAEFTSRRG